MTSVLTNHRDADAPTPQDGVEQAAADQTLKQRQPEQSTLGTISGVIADVCDVTEVVGGIFSIFE
jgi:hypothetical protein